MMDQEQKPSPREKPDSGKETKKPARSAGKGASSGKASRPGAGEKKPETAARPAARRPVTRRSRGPVYEQLQEDPILTLLQQELGGEEVAGQSFLGQRIVTVSLESLFDTLLWLRERAEADFDYLVDLTALDYLGDQQRFCVVYQLYSHRHGALLRVKSRCSEAQMVPSVTSIWPNADWMEREVYDMFGIEFSGHPDLKRILLPEDWHGHPLRKDYDIKLQDQSWIKKHLRIRKVPG